MRSEITGFLEHIPKRPPSPAVVSVSHHTAFRIDDGGYAVHRRFRFGVVNESLYAVIELAAVSWKFWRHGKCFIQSSDAPALIINSLSKLMASTRFMSEM